MYPNEHAEPMCSRDPRTLGPGDSKTDLVDDGTGGKVRRTDFTDGSSTTHGGGPCGDRHSDKWGREC